MNKTREALLGREKVLQETGGDQALSFAQLIPTLIQQGDTMPFYKAQDQAAMSFAHQHSISESGAKKLMKDTFEEVEGRSLYEVGKELEAKHHAPIREAQKVARKEKQQARTHAGPER